MLVTDFRDYFSVLCWWPIFDVGAKLLMLVTWVVTNIQNLSPTHLVTNIRHQHRCNLQIVFCDFHWRLAFSIIKWHVMGRFDCDIWTICCGNWMHAKVGHSRGKRFCCSRNRFCRRIRLYRNSCWTGQKLFQESLILLKQFISFGMNLRVIVESYYFIYQVLFWKQIDP